MTPNRWQVFWGGMLIIIGTLFLLSSLRLVPITFADVFQYGWPLFLILIGVLILLPDARRGNWSWSPGIGAGDHDDILDGKEIRDLKLSHGIGDYYVDLAHAIFPEGTAHVQVSHGIGELKIRLPKDVAVKLRATVGIGEAKALDERADGMGARVEKTTPDFETAARKLSIEASLGLGDLTIRRAE